MSHRDTKSRRVASVGRTKNNHRYAVTSHNPLVNLELSRGTSMIHGSVPSKPTNLFRIGAPVHTKSHKRKRSPSPTHTRKKNSARVPTVPTVPTVPRKRVGGRVGGMALEERMPRGQEVLTKRPSATADSTTHTFPTPCVPPRRRHTPTPWSRPNHSPANKTGFSTRMPAPFSRVTLMRGTARGLAHRLLTGPKSGSPMR